jgi:hypothetical protein
MKTLLLALISPGKSHGTREGAIRGLVGVGKEAVRKGLVEGGGAKVVGAEWESGEGGRSTGLVNSVMVRLTLFFSFFDLYLIFKIAGGSEGASTCFGYE